MTDYVILWNGGTGTIFSVKVESTTLLNPLQYTFNSPDIEADKDYLFQVKARNAVGLSSASDQLLIISVSLPVAPASAPTVIKAQTDAT